MRAWKRWAASGEASSICVTPTFMSVVKSTPVREKVPGRYDKGSLIVAMEG
jgi:hypothetical protein